MQIYAIIPQPLGKTDSPTFAGQTITGNSVFGLNSSVFQPTTDSTTFFQVLDANGGVPILNIDSTNERVGIGTNAPTELLEVSGTGVFGVADTLGIDLTNITESTIGNVTPMLQLSARSCGSSETGGPYLSGFNRINFAGNQLEFFNLVDVATTATVVGGGADGDAYRRFRLLANGEFRWGPGTTATDFRLYRLDAGTIILEGDKNGIVKFYIDNANAGALADAAFLWRRNGSTKWCMGIDASDSDLMILSNTSTLANPLYSWNQSDPYYTLRNLTHEDTDGGRESRHDFKGQQSGGEETTLARIEASHDGAADDEKGKVVISVNDGDDADTPTETMRLDSNLAAIFTKVKITPLGGIAIKLTNETGANSIAGYCVTNDDSTADAVRLVPINEPNCIGVFLESGIADGSEAWIVVAGIADVYFWGNTTLGHMARTGLTADTGEVSGQAISETVPTSPFSVDKHFCEVGHVLESRVGAGLARCVLHFN